MAAELRLLRKMKWDFMLASVRRAFSVARRVRAIGYDGAVQSLDLRLGKGEYELLWTMVEWIVETEEAERMNALFGGGDRGG